MLMMTSEKYAQALIYGKPGRQRDIYYYFAILADVIMIRISFMRFLAHVRNISWLLSGHEIKENEDS